MEELDTSALSTNAAIIAVTETWLTNPICDNEVCIPGYSIQRKDRNREGGGVCIFIRNNIKGPLSVKPLFLMVFQVYNITPAHLQSLG